jgi:hypothetical protein
MQIFLSYRRSDSQAIARLIGDKLRGEYDVFQDVTEIDPGAKFVDVIRDALEKSDIFLVLIGPEWVREKSSLDPDYVYLEVETALSNQLQVLPILVEGASMPRADSLPQSIRLLTQINALKIDPGRNMDSQINDLCEAIEAGADTRAKLGDQYRMIRDARRAALALEQADWTFSADVVGDQYVFLLTLQRFLDSTRDLFKVQSALARDLIRDIKTTSGGLDDVIRDVADQIPADRYWLRRRLRRETDTMREVHGALLRLLGRNRAMYSLVPNLQDLYDHLSIWVAKYECLRNDDEMCLIFVGVKQKMKFPTQVEIDIVKAVDELDKRLKFR